MATLEKLTEIYLVEVDITDLKPFACICLTLHSCDSWTCAGNTHVSVARIGYSSNFG